jgi:hypothetical protein
MRERTAPSRDQVRSGRSQAVATMSASMLGTTCPIDREPVRFFCCPLELRRLRSPLGPKSVTRRSRRLAARNPTFHWRVRGVMAPARIEKVTHVGFSLWPRRRGSRHARVVPYIVGAALCARLTSPSSASTKRMRASFTASPIHRHIVRTFAHLRRRLESRGAAMSRKAAARQVHHKTPARRAGDCESALRARYHSIET